LRLLIQVVQRLGVVSLRQAPGNAVPYREEFLVRHRRVVNRHHDDPLANDARCVREANACAVHPGN
jgi:hypothetical protein